MKVLATQKIIAVVALLFALVSHDGGAQGAVLRITIPTHSAFTPVQGLNREGVAAVNRHQYEKAEALFYKAYLYDPGDPFTLNNLGYISEIQGELDRAHKFYVMASEQGSSANIDRSSAKRLEGQSMQTALSNLNSVGMQANRMNVDAMELLTEHRGSEAVSLLLKALSLDPDNPFTKNNLGVANESIGDYDAALKYYGAAASSNSNEAVVVTLDRSWRGKLIREMAAQSATRLEQRMKKIGTIQSNILMLSLRGVSETNHNNWVAARQDFLQAYSLDPSSAFSLNNRGYVAERDGDMETAQFYYAQARKADDSNTRIGMATLQSAEGRKLSTVAADSDRQVDSELEIYKQKRRQRSGPIELTPRGDASNEDPGVPPKVPAPADVPPAVEVPTPQPQ